ncbi:MAG: aminotransferase class III-fold pyridoxal phosphate-dependent enzyme [Deltaproteobacteria bacterium]|nr:aminotransferase class III-fold pyridoxal phosphate-dependent enzyme [Deltaproteobacteria bacterium]MBM4341166.1 aminotransferase class III-fold pyridoxal phosphate-dependent enzyme [Deltaproteobacteria bacterium]
MEFAYPKGHVFYRKLSRTYPLVTQGEGIYLYDEKGRRYIDGSGGALVVNVGHGQKEIVQKMVEQMGQVGYVHGTQFTTRSIEEYAETLGGILPDGLEKIYFLSGGSESIEAAIKFARQYFLESGHTQRWRVISRWHSYHGNTLGALSLTGRIGMRKPYLPLLIDFPHFPPPYCYRCPFNLSYPQCELECAKTLEQVIQMEGPETISAVILEPIGGATIGALVPPEGYLSLIRKICDRFGILLIDDEVMTGMGRTGKWFAVKHWDISPDIMVLGKGMSSGYFPLSAMITRSEFVERVKERAGGFVHGHTFSHHPVACAVGLAVIQFIKEKKLIEQSAKRGAYLLKRLDELKVFRFVGDVRGRGLMTAIEFVKDQKTKEPFPRVERFTERVIDLAFEHGLILYPGTGFVDGINGDMVMVGPPLIIEEDQVDELIEILKKTFKSISEFGLRNAE